TVENTIRTVDGIQYTFNSGGPIPYGMAGYPTNISFASGDPYHPSTDPNTNPSVVGGAAWWWAQANDPASLWYDPQVVACTPGTPCTWAIGGLVGDPSDNQGIADWINEITSLTGGALEPFEVWPCLCQFLNFPPSDAAYENPLISEVGTGWAPDYPDPTDYVAPEAQPANVYTEADAFGQQLGVTNPAGWDANNTTCGHSAVTFADLAYWAHAADDPAGGLLSGVCQGVAYGVANAYFDIAAELPVGPARNLDYNLAEHITNGLAMYVWNGQSNEVLSAAPWISGSSLNTNVMIGGGGDLIWFHVAYAPFQQAVTFKETGLPSGQTWAVNAGSPVTSRLNTTGISGGSLLFHEPNGTLGFTVTPPAGYGVARVSGPDGTTFGTAPISTTTTITVKFGLLEPLTFTEKVVQGWPGIVPFGLGWGVTLHPAGTGGPPGMTNTTAVAFGTIGFEVPKGAHYTWTVSPPAGFQAAGGVHSLTMPGHTETKFVKFRPYAERVTFREVGLGPAGTLWSVTLTGPPSWGIQTLTSSGSTKAFELPNGSYTFVIPAVGGETPSPASGSLTAVALHSATIRVVFAPTHLPGDPFGGAGSSQAPTLPAPHPLTLYARPEYRDG
ncbi:MAG: hypothetical protein ACLQD8_08240, partial [Thermoplasmata archaeon]